jgi:hypothetical protein
MGLRMLQTKRLMNYRANKHNTKHFFIDIQKIIMKRRKTEISYEQNITVPFWLPLAFLLALISLSLLLACLPYFSKTILIVGLVIASISTIPLITLLLTGKRYLWMGVTISAGVISYFWGFALRNFMGVVPGRGVWSILLTFSFLIALLLPIISPSISKFLWREQIQPETFVGKNLLNIIILIAPIAGTLGASLRLIKGEVSEYPVTFFIFGVLSWFFATLMTFAMSYQILANHLQKEKKKGAGK